MAPKVPQTQVSNIIDCSFRSVSVKLLFCYESYLIKYKAENDSKASHKKIQDIDGFLSGLHFDIWNWRLHHKLNGRSIVTACPIIKFVYFGVSH